MSIKDMIDLNSYINSFNLNEREFYKTLFNTQMFIEFIYKRMMPKDCGEKVEILFFEEKINEKVINKKIFGKSKLKDQNVLLSSKEYDFVQAPLTIDCSKEIGVTQDYYGDLISDKNMQKNLLDNGYDIEIDSHSKTINFNYHIFPCILSNKYFLYYNQYYKVSEQYYKQIDLINAKIVNKSHLKFNSKDTNFSEMRNDLYLCYLIIWSLTIAYTDTWERDYRFLGMIEIIEKVEGHDIEIFELLFS